MRHHDLVIIGTGSGNSIVNHRFDGLDVAIIEHGVFGGTCLNVGCIPTKMFVLPADLVESARGAARLGIDATVDKIRFTDIRDRIFNRIDPISAGGRDYRINLPNVTVYEGHARFTGPHALTVEHTDGSGTDEITADKIVIAAGGRPVIPPVITDSGVTFHTSDTVMRIDAVPDRLVIIGGGYIGTEFAHVFSAFGAHTTLVVRGPELLRDHDATIRERFTALARQRWDVRTHTEVTAATEHDGVITLTLSDGTTLDTDLLLVATGRRANTDLLDVDRAGLATHDDGRLVVDDQQRTTVDGIWALGDISSPYQLKHVANHEARIVKHNLLHPEDPKRTDHRFVPHAVFTRPQIAAVGRTEEQCRAEGRDITVKIQAYGDVAYGWAMEDTTGFCKVIADRSTGQLLGAHVMGPQAATVIQPLIQAMSFGLGAREMATDQYWIHPALPEVVENALLGLDLA
ncbi:mycothione reductase [Pseudonocardia sp. CA-107938]|uniref:mycothione reductase n=1 Tax=Pseudonocardia sp. CA-107938 TaxID=3240021 RepID=UPI003D903AAD